MPSCLTACSALPAYLLPLNCLLCSLCLRAFPDLSAGLPALASLPALLYAACLPVLYFLRACLHALLCLPAFLDHLHCLSALLCLPDLHCLLA
jgi:hypothetical protein